MKDDLLESFKQYHNANWHDGDNTFDERTYAKSNGDDFDDQFVQYCFEHYEAGYHSGYEKAVKKVVRKSYGLTKEKADRISINTRNAYMMRYRSTSEAKQEGDFERY